MEHSGNKYTFDYNVILDTSKCNYDGRGSKSSLNNKHIYRLLPKLKFDFTLSKKLATFVNLNVKNLTYITTNMCLKIILKKF